MKNYLAHIKVLVLRLTILILVFQLTRLLFFFFNYSSFESSKTSDILIAFLWGTRFDIWVIFWFNAIIILFYLFPGNYKNSKGFQVLFKYYFIIVNSIILLPNLIDLEYFKFTNKRSTADIFSFIGTGEDTWVMLPQFLKDFWFVIVIWIVLIILIWKLYKAVKIKTLDAVKLNIRHVLFQLLTFVIIGSIMFMVLRGTNLRPVNIMSAARFVTNKEIPLVLNTPFSVIRTWSKDNLIVKKYFTEKISEQYFSPVYKIISDKPNSNQGKNVVIIILESFSKEYIGYFNSNCSGFTPFLDSILGKSLVFENSFANGKKSMESLPAILAGIPSLSETPYVLSKYVTNKIDALPSILKRQGYSTSFYHGGTNGTMGFDVFSILAGFDSYYGRNEYPNSTDYDGHWGIWDEQYLQYFSSQLDNKKEPFFSLVYTLSSHHPYKVPEKYKSKLPKGKYEIFQSIAYTDLALRKFFEKSKKSKWFNNTVFLITADHTFWALDEYYNNSVGMYSVPIAMYCISDSLLVGKNENIMQHSDITPSIIDYLSYNDSVICFGKSSFDNSSYHFSINYLNGNYQLIKDNYLLLFDGDVSVALFDYKKDRMLNSNLLERDKTKTLEMEMLIKSIIQNYNNRLISNKLTFN